MDLGLGAARPTPAPRSSSFTNSIASMPSSSAPATASTTSPFRKSSLSREGIAAATSGPAFLDTRRGPEWGKGGGKPKVLNVDFSARQVTKVQRNVDRRGSFGLNRTGKSATSIANQSIRSPPTQPHPAAVAQTPPPPPPYSQSNHSASQCMSPTSANPEWHRLTSPKSGYIQRMGVHTLFAAASPTAKFTTIFKPPSILSSYISRAVLTAKIKPPKLDPADPLSRPEHAQTFLLFNVVDVLTYCCLTIDPLNGGYYMLTSHAAGAVKKLGKVSASPPIRANLFVAVSIDVTLTKGKTAVTVFANNTNLFNGLKIDSPSAGQETNGVGQDCWYGIMCKGGRCVVKDWTATYFTDSNTAIECKMTNGVDASRGGNGGGESAEDKAVEVEYAGMDADDRKFAPMIMSDVVETSNGLSFDSIVGCEVAKRLLTEAIILPMVVPQLFTGIRRPWKGVLLYGPPGTGKTLLAKAVAGQNGSNFFNCSTATLVSKYRGESEKIVKCLFWLARFHAPSVVFLDEVDALVGARGGEGEHEASRRFKTEMFVQIDGVVHGGEGGERVMVLAATNNPWDLDDAMVRRLEKRIYIGLPDEEERAGMFLAHIEKMNCGEEVRKYVGNFSRSSFGYSGADIKQVCGEASMERMRKVLSEVDVKDLVRMKKEGGDEFMKREKNCVGVEDFVVAIGNTKNTVKSEARFVEWDEKYGSR